MNKIDLFKVSIYNQENFITEKCRKDILDFIFKSSNVKDYFIDHGALTKGQSTYSPQKADGVGIYNLIELLSKEIESCKNLKDKIENCLIECSKDFSFIKSKIELSNSWFNIQKKGSILFPHTHPKSTFSGVIFLNTDDNSSGLSFFNPNTHIKYFEHYENTNSLNAEYYTIKPKNCSLYIFPSFLSHGSYKDINQTKQRVVLSFNSKVEYN